VMVRASATARWTVAALVVLVATGGCTGPMRRLYPGPALPPAEVALLKHQTGFANPSVYFVAIDDTVFPRVAKRFFDVELLPGKHVVRFGFDAAEAYAIDEATVEFSAAAGRVYEARALFQRSYWNVFPSRDTWQGVIVDLGTNEVVSAERPPSAATPTSE
jgi:hypothetical protein